MTEDEKYVREHWERIDWSGDYDHGTYLRIGYGYSFDVKNDVGNPELYLKPEHYEQIWSAAAEFTRTRLEQIRDVEEEISLLSGWKWVVTGNDAAKRILAREQAALADLKRGLRVAE